MVGFVFEFVVFEFEFCCELGGEFGNLGSFSNYDNQQSGWTREKPLKKESTTIGIVATDAILDKSQATRIATAAQDGIARAIFPSHTPFDGDLLFSVSTGKFRLEDSTFDTLKIGHAGAQCVARAIARAIYNATPSDSDILPCWSNFNKRP